MQGDSGGDEEPEDVRFFEGETFKPGPGRAKGMLEPDFDSGKSLCLLAVGKLFVEDCFGNFGGRIAVGGGNDTIDVDNWPADEGFVNVVGPRKNWIVVTDCATKG